MSPQQPDAPSAPTTATLWPISFAVAVLLDGTGATARIHRFLLRGPGEPASGPESWLYPVDPIR